MFPVTHTERTTSMKTGRTIDAIASEIQTTLAAREDFVAPGKAIQMMANGNSIRLNNEYYAMTSTAHSNLSRRLEIPKAYYDKMLTETPDLLSQNVNEWMARSENHLVRALNTKLPVRDEGNTGHVCRAVLSDRYRIIDNDFIMEGLFPILQENAGMKVESCEITDTRFYLKARFPSLERDVAVGDPVQSGVCITNSEVGFGAASASMLIYRLICTNGMVVADTAFKARKNHIGRVMEYGDDFQIIASDETVALQNETFLAHLKDIIKAAADADAFHAVVSKLQDAAERKISGNIEEAVERVVKYASLNVAEGESVLENLARSHDYSQWGLANAITRSAEDVVSYDRASDLERIGGRIIDLAPADWNRIAA